MPTGHLEARSIQQVKGQQDKDQQDKGQQIVVQQVVPAPTFQVLAVKAR